jgi:hypothetical protein
MPTSAAQQAANQANAQHSTGPRTPEGKQASSRNSLRHGFRSRSVLLPGDDPAEYQALLDSLTEHFTPGDLIEERAVREMADAEWRLWRVREALEYALSQKCEQLAAEHPGAKPEDLQALAWIAARPDVGPLMKYEQKYERQYDRAFRTWTRYQEAKQMAEFRAAKEIVRQAEAEERAVHAQAEERIEFLKNKKRANEPNSAGPATPRNAPCPCGSGVKFKRCCGRHAPPVLDQHQRPAA